MLKELYSRSSSHCELLGWSLSSRHKDPFGHVTYCTKYFCLSQIVSNDPPGPS